MYIIIFTENIISNNIQFYNNVLFFLFNRRLGGTYQPNANTREIKLYLIL
jgi:hypothetical protein